MATLKTDYTDDVLNASKNKLRKYQQITNDDGTVSFVDVTDYTTVGSELAASNINAITTQINTNTSAISTLNESLTNSPRIYHYYGLLYNCDGDSSSCGYGTVSVILFANGIAQIDYSYKITNNGSVSTFLCGLNRDFLTSTCGVTITPISGGVVSYYTSDGVIAADLQGYAGTHQAKNQFWDPARIYSLPGTVGGWNVTDLRVNIVLIGTCYGTYS